VTAESSPFTYFLDVSISSQDRTSKRSECTTVDRTICPRLNVTAVPKPVLPTVINFTSDQVMTFFITAEISETFAVVQSNQNSCRQVF
jgi:hypothetical protein